MALVIVLAICLMGRAAYAGTVTLVPNGDPSNLTGNNTTSWVGSVGGSEYSILATSTTGVTPYLCGQSGTWGYLYDMTTANVGQGATSLTVEAYSQIANALTGSDDVLALNAYIGGSAVGSSLLQRPQPTNFGSTCLSQSGATWQTVTYNGSWTQSQIDGMQLYLGRQTTGGSSEPISVARANIIVNYTDSPTFAQSNNRVYANADSTTPGTPLAADNTTAELPSQGSAFRIRTGIVPSGTAWNASYGSFNLQFAQLTAASCSAQTGYATVQSGSGAIQWYNNPSVADNTAISSYVNDPAGTKTYETYRESNSFGTINTVSTGNLALWDFSLKDASATPGATYCFRIVNSDGSALASYSYYPQVTTVGNLGVDIVDTSGNSVANPVVNFANLIAMPQCQVATATLGTASQKIRITNNLVTNGWSTSIAATNGPTAIWSSGGGDSYDYNDSGGSPNGCSDGSDADTVGGQLTVDPSSSSSTPQSGCSTTGLSLGTSAPFVEGSTDAITLLNASASSQRFCYWDLTSIGLSQRVPAGTPVGSYALDLTVTTVAS